MIGTGNMNGAILAGLTAGRGDGAEPIRVTTRSTKSAEQFADDDAVLARAAEDDPEANREAVRGAGAVILGVKPYAIVDALEEIAPALDPGAVIISVAAGVELATMEAHLPEGAKIVRAMPNTPATIGLGATGIAAGRHADAEAMALARAIFESVGAVVEVPESGIALVGAVSGSGPAHVYLLIERMIEASERIGLSEEDARALVVQTFRGAVEMVARHPELEPAELRRRVTSPNGTTEQSVRVLVESGLEDRFEAALRANIARSEELAAEHR